VKLALFALWLALAVAPDAVMRIAGLEGLFAVLAYLALLGWSVVGLVAAAFIPQNLLRWVLAALFAFAAFFASTVAAITGDFLTYDAFINLVGSTGFAGDALRQYGSAFLAPLVLSIVLLFALGLPPQMRFSLPRFTVAIPLAVVASITALLFMRAGDGARGLPASYPAMSYAALYAGESIVNPRRPREEPALPLAEQPGRHVVLVIDESIAGHYLDFNDPDGVATPLTGPLGEVQLANFGVVPAITNCSVGSNLALRFGGTRKNYTETIASGPSIWAYAKAAGLRTVYIDAQRTDGALHNAMTQDELALIDSFIQFDDVAVLDRDLAAAERLAAELESPRPSLILVNKVGAHFPVHDKFPDSHMTYRPVLPRGGWSDVSDTGSREGFDGSAESWRRYRNSYRNALSWNVGAFFERLLTLADLSSTVLIYTADHGQDLEVQDDVRLSTHCNSNPRVSEGAVPLLTLSADPRWQVPTSALGEGSHYRIMPTLLQLMGYEPRAVEARYGPALTSTAAEPDTFNARFNARLGQSPDWRSISEGGLSNPVALDSGTGPREPQTRARRQRSPQR